MDCLVFYLFHLIYVYTSFLARASVQSQSHEPPKRHFGLPSFFFKTQIREIGVDIWAKNNKTQNLIGGARGQN
jgi:hypothetical protein